MHRGGWLNILPSVGGRQSVFVASSPLGRAGVCQPFQPLDARAGAGWAPLKISWRSGLGALGIAWADGRRTTFLAVVAVCTWRMGVVRSVWRFGLFAGVQTISVGLLGG